MHIFCGQPQFETVFENSGVYNTVCYKNVSNTWGLCPHALYPLTQVEKKQLDDFLDENLKS